MVKTLVVNGDLCDAKDNHPATLVNRVVGEIAETRRAIPQVIINQGNHDYLQRGSPFFAFLSNLDGVDFITKPTEFMIGPGPGALFLPHTRSPGKDWRTMDFSHYNMLFIHQTVKGARGSNGRALDGEELPLLNAGKVWSGDIHVPQVVGDVEYIGSPYPVHFGDTFTPRVVLLDRRGRAHDLHIDPPPPRRISAKVSSLRDLKELRDGLTAGDQLKVRVMLDAASRHEWPSLKQAASELSAYVSGVELAGVELEIEPSARRFDRAAGRTMTDAERLLAFVEAEGLPAEVLEIGEALMQEGRP